MIYLVRGLIRNHRHWHGFEKTLIDKLSLDKSQIVFYNFCVSKNYKDIIKYSDIYFHINNLKNFIKAAGHNSIKINFIGISLGGLFLLKFFESNPEYFNSLTMINSSHPNYSKFYHRMSFIRLSKIVFFGLMGKKFAEYAILTTTINQKSVIKKLLKKNYEIYKKYPWSYPQLFAQLLMASCGKNFNKVDKNYADFNNRILLLVSTGDRLVSSRCSIDLFEKLNCTMFVHSSAGHDLSGDDPLWCAEMIKKFLSQLPKTS